jgi:hypothetical protein
MTTPQGRKRTLHAVTAEKSAAPTTSGSATTSPRVLNTQEDNASTSSTPASSSNSQPEVTPPNIVNHNTQHIVDFYPPILEIKTTTEITPKIWDEKTQSYVLNKQGDHGSVVTHTTAPSFSCKNSNFYATTGLKGVHGVRADQTGQILDWPTSTSLREFGLMGGIDKDADATFGLYQAKTFQARSKSLVRKPYSPPYSHHNQDLGQRTADSLGLLTRTATVKEIYDLWTKG